MWPFRGKEPAETRSFDRGDVLRSIPAIVPGVTFEPEEDGHLLACIPVRPATGFLARFQPRVSRRRVRLDEIGAFVIGQIDGGHTVLHIAEAFARQYHVSRREAELATADFLKSLAQRNIIAIGVR